MKLNWSRYRSGMKIGSSLVQSVTRTRARSRTEKLCFGLFLFTTRPSAVSVFRTHWRPCEIGFPTSSRREYSRYRPRSSLLCRRASDTSETSEEPFGKSVDQIRRGPPVVADLSAARGDMEAEEILHGGQVWSVNALVETALPGAGLAGGCKALLDVLLHYF
jgi:hypothetical protein